jgi:putative addiction module component (TIGR02574 family)
VKPGGGTASARDTVCNSSTPKHLGSLRALQLPADDRLALATDILESVEGPEDPKWVTAWAVELDRRVRELDAGTAKTISWEQVRSETLGRLRSK